MEREKDHERERERERCVCVCVCGGGGMQHSMITAFRLESSSVKTATHTCKV